MVTYLLYTKDSPEARQLERFAHELDSLQIETKLVEADSPEGTSLVELYDLAQRPAVVVATDDGTMINRWMGDLPLADEISYYVHQ